MATLNNKYFTGPIQDICLLFNKLMVANQQTMCEKHSKYNAILITVYSNFLDKSKMKTFYTS